jgi:16S rRNA (cytidine1402-2'-O)-methyltransferase
MSQDPQNGRLILLGAPLGNPADASPRLAESLAAADLVAAEDTRRLRRLATELNITITAPIMSYFDGNERQRTPQLLERLTGGDTVVLITDGGMPSVSDPGFRLVHAAVSAGATVTSVPGPSAVTTALAVSGLPCERFCFEGFLPRKAGERSHRLAELATEPRTMVFFESPRRVTASLAALVEAFGPQRQAALCRELTKTFEEVRRAGLRELLEGAEIDPPRGEITLVIAGAPSQMAGPADPVALAEAVQSLLDDGVDRKTALSGIAKRFGVPKREVYDAVLAARHAEP